jgi:hypothetical protein
VNRKKKNSNKKIIKEKESKIKVLTHKLLDLQFLQKKKELVKDKKVKPKEFKALHVYS